MRVLQLLLLPGGLARQFYTYRLEDDLEDPWSQESGGGFGARIPVVGQLYPRPPVEQTTESPHHQRTSDRRADHPRITEKQTIGPGYLERDSDRRANQPKLTKKHSAGAGYLEIDSDRMADQPKLTKKQSSIGAGYLEIDSDRRANQPKLTKKHSVGPGYLERDSDRWADQSKLTKEQTIGPGYLERDSDRWAAPAEGERRTRKYSAVVDKWRKFNSEPFDGVPVDFDFELNLELGQTSNSIQISPDLVYRKKRRKRRKKPNSEWKRLTSSSLIRTISPTTSSPSSSTTTTRRSPVPGVEDSSWDLAHAWQVMDRARNTQFLLALQGLDFRPPASQPAATSPVYRLAGHPATLPPASQPATQPTVYQLAGRLATPPPVLLAPPPVSVTEAPKLPFLLGVQEDTTIQTFSQQWWPGSEVPADNVDMQQIQAFESKKKSGRSRPQVYHKRRRGLGWGLMPGSSLTSSLASSLGPSLTSSLASFLKPLWGVLGGRGGS